MDLSPDTSCADKTRHESRAEAQGAIAALRRAGRAKGRLHAYGCNFCFGVHVGVIRPRDLRAQRTRGRESAFAA